MKRLLLASLFLSGAAYASESTIVLTDNTVIRTVHHYTPMASMNWADDTAIIRNPIAEAECFDRIADFSNRADRYRQLDKCLVTGVLA